VFFLHDLGLLSLRDGRVLKSRGPWGCDQNSVVRTLLEKGSQHPDITEKRAVNRAASLTDDRSGVNIFSSALLANLKINQHNKSESRVGTGQISAPVKYRRQPPAELCFAENLPDSGPSLFVCYPRPLARLRTQTSSTRDPNFILVSFHFLSYLTCPFLSLPRTRPAASAISWSSSRGGHMQTAPNRRVDLEEQDVELVNFDRSIWLDHSGPRSLVAADSAPSFSRSPITVAN
jgi:hypothetical protein